MTARADPSPTGSLERAATRGRPSRWCTRLLVGLVPCWLVMPWLVTACTEQTPAQFPTANELPDDDRRPDGIAVDLTSDPPPSQNRAATDEDIVTLRTPLGTQVALRTVRTFFDALIGEDVSGLSIIVAPNAMNEDTRSGSRRRSASILNMWSERFRKREYQKLATRLVYRDADVMIYRTDQLAALPLAARLRTSTAAHGSNDLVLRVPIITHTVKNERLLGDEVFLWLERREDSFVIARTAESVPF